MKTIIFVHGMFQTPVSWENWISYFQSLGYTTLAPAWPLHDADPVALRANVPEGTGDLELSDLIAHIETLVDAQSEPPIVIGHSLGGLITLVLADKGKIAAGVAISPVAPNAMLSFEWPFLKNSTPILNPLMGDSVQEMTPELFHSAIANTLSEEASEEAWQRTAVHESRNVLRTALGKAGHIDLKKPHVPLLFLSGAEDQIIPASLTEKTFDAYGDAAGVKTLQNFQGRSHFICGEPGWEEVASVAANWLEANAPSVV